MRFILILLLLSGCATASVCPSLVDYSPEFNEGLTEELMPLDDDSALVRAVLDYDALRAQVRACE